MVLPQTPRQIGRAFDATHGRHLVLRTGARRDSELALERAARAALHDVIDELASGFVDGAPRWRQDRMAALDGARLDYTRASLDVVDGWAMRLAEQTSSALRAEHVIPELAAYFTRTMFLCVPGLCWTSGATFASRGLSAGRGPFRYHPQALVELLFDSGLGLGVTMDLALARADPESAPGWPCGRWAR